MTDPFHCNIMSLFVRLFNEDFSEYTWDATRASLNLVIQPSSYGFKVKYNLKLQIKYLCYKFKSFFLDAIEWI